MERLKTIINKQKVLQGLILSQGNVEAATKIAHISKTQFYYWLNNDSEFKERYIGIIRGVMTFCKTKRMKKVYEEDKFALEKHIGFLARKLKVEE